MSFAARAIPLYGSDPYPNASVALDFVRGFYKAPGSRGGSLSAISGFSYSRTGTEYAQTSSGLFVAFPSNVPAITDRGFQVWGARTNTVPNSGMSGATSSTLPTGWQVAAAGGLTPTVVGTGTENGLAYVDVQVVGTPSATATAVVATGGGGVGGFGATSGAAQAQVWTASHYNRLVGGALTNLTFATVINENNASGTFLSSGSTAFTPTATMAQATHTRTLASATTAGCYESLNFNLTSGQAVNVTIRIYAPQLELAATAGPPIITTNASATRGAVSATLTFTGSPATSRVTYGTGVGTVATANNPVSPLDLGSASGGAWVNNVIQRVTLP